MSLPAWHEEPISNQHNRDSFDCGEEALNEFLRRHARKSHDLGGSKTFVAVDDYSRLVLGYFTLSPGSMEYERTPAAVRRGLGRYEVPMFRLARLAVDRSVQGKGLGGKLLLAAGRRCLLVAEQVGGVAMLIDAKNDGVARWYAGFGARALPDSPLTLVLPLATIAAVLAEDEEF